MDCSAPGFPVLHHLLEFAQKLKSIETVMPSNYLILCHPLLLRNSKLAIPSLHIKEKKTIMLVKCAYMHTWFFCSIVCKVIIFNIFLPFDFFFIWAKNGPQKGKGWFSRNRVCNKFPIFNCHTLKNLGQMWNTCNLNLYILINWSSALSESLCIINLWCLLYYPALTGRFFTTAPPGKPFFMILKQNL